MTDANRMTPDEIRRMVDEAHVCWTEVCYESGDGEIVGGVTHYTDVSDGIEFMPFATTARELEPDERAAIESALLARVRRERQGDETVSMTREEREKRINAVMGKYADVPIERQRGDETLVGITPSRLRLIRSALGASQYHGGKYFSRDHMDFIDEQIAAIDEVLGEGCPDCGARLEADDE